MAKKNIKPVIPAAPTKPLQPVFNFPAQTKYIILAIVGLIFYGNTLMNDYALDDNGVILGNTYVQNGISGIGKIMTNDAYSSFLIQMHASQNFTGGRYRPLSIVIFAIEHTLFGESRENSIAWLRHLMNILFYIATLGAIFYFLSNFLLKKLPRGEDMAFMATVLFAIHPMHTEVTANIKSFDEILSLFFILLTFIFGLKYLEEGKTGQLVWGLVSFFLSLLAKEYAITLLVLIPLLFYLYPFNKKVSPIMASLPYFAVAFFYIILRFASVGIPKSDSTVRLLNNQLRMDPYFLATHIQRFATEWYALGKYLFMLFVPYPLSCDYSYNQIPYHNFSNITVLLSLLAYIGIAYLGFKLLMKKDILAFPVFFYLLMLFPISNFFISVGAVFGERFDYHASLGFAIVVTYYIFRYTKNISLATRKIILPAGLGIIALACAAETIARNGDWKNDTILFVHDVKVVPNSEFADCNAAVGYINMAMDKGNEKRKTELLDTAIMFCKRAIAMDKGFPDPFVNAGQAYYFESNLDSAKRYWDIIQNGLYPNHPIVKRYLPALAKSFMLKGVAEGQSNPSLGITDMKNGLTEDSTNWEIWYNLGGAYYSIHKFDSAKYAWVRSLAIKRDSNASADGLRALMK